MAPLVQRTSFLTFMCGLPLLLHASSHEMRTMHLNHEGAETKCVEGSEAGAADEVSAMQVNRRRGKEKGKRDGEKSEPCVADEMSAMQVNRRRAKEADKRGHADSEDGSAPCVADTMSAMQAEREGDDADEGSEAGLDDEMSAMQVNRRRGKERSKRDSEEGSSGPCVCDEMSAMQVNRRRAKEKDKRSRADSQDCSEICAIDEMSAMQLNRQEDASVEGSEADEDDEVSAMQVNRRRAKEADKRSHANCEDCLEACVIDEMSAIQLQRQEDSSAEGPEAGAADEMSAMQVNRRRAKENDKLRHPKCGHCSEACAIDEMSAMQVIRHEDSSAEVSEAGAADEMSAMQVNHKALGITAESSWSQSCAPFPGKRVMLVTANTQYMDFLENWLIHAAPFLDTKTDQLVIAAENKDVVPQLEKLKGAHGVNYEIYHDDDWAAVENVTAESRYSFGGSNKVFGSVVTHRPKVISQLLNKGCTVVYHDIDTVWIKPLFATLEAHGKHDLIVADDATKPNETNLCTCLLYFQPTKAGKALVERWEALSEGKPKNQPAFNLAVKEMKGDLDYVILPPTEFPNGRLWQHGKDGVRTTAVVVHANFREGKWKKANFLNSFGFWKMPLPDKPN